MSNSFKDLGNTLRVRREMAEAAEKAHAIADEQARQKEEERKKQRAIDLQKALIAFDAESFRILRGAYQELLTAGAEVGGGQKTPGADSTQPMHVFALHGDAAKGYEIVIGQTKHQWLSFFDIRIGRMYRIGFARHQAAHHAIALVLGQTLNGEATHKSLKAFDATSGPIDAAYAAELHKALFSAISTLVEGE